MTASGGGTLTYSGGIPLNASTTVNARVRYQTGSSIVWSAISSYKFKYNLTALHVTEVNYNPAPPPVGPTLPRMATGPRGALGPSTKRGASHRGHTSRTLQGNL